MVNHRLLDQTVVLRWVLIRRRSWLELGRHEVFDLTLLHHQTPSALLDNLRGTCEGKLRLYV